MQRTSKNSPVKRLWSRLRRARRFLAPVIWTEKQPTYLLEGQVELVAEDGQTTKIDGGADVAKHPMANLQPRKHAAKAVTPCKITRFDSDLLDMLLTWDQLSGIEVSEIQVEDDDDSDWMTRIL